MENNEKNPFQFNILGLPSNEEIEVEDEEETKTSYKHQPKLPKEVEEAFNEIFGSDQSNRLDELLKSAAQVTPAEKAMMERMMKQLGLSINLDALYNDEEDEDDNTVESDGEDSKETETPSKFIFELGKIEHLVQKEAFQQILVQEDPDLYLKFIEDFGKGPYSTSTFSKKDIPCFSSCPIPLTKITQFMIVDHTNKYVLLYGTTNDKAEQGIFMAVAKNESGNYQLIIPEYGNTYNLKHPDDQWSNEEMFENNPENCELYSINTNPELFTEEGKFKFLDIDKVHAGLDWLLCQSEEPLVTPNKFGNLVQMRSSVDQSNYQQSLRIGVLKSNESPTAILFKRDFDIPEEKMTFDFYLKFPEPLPGVVVNYIADYLNSVDLRTSQLLDNRELKNVGRGDKLYINFDLGKIGDNLGKWINPKGNSEF